MARPSRADARTAMTYTTLDYTVTDRVLTLTLNRPDRLNAFTVTMADELEHAFRRASADDLVGAIVVTGAGRAFCAGMDLATTGNVFGLDETQHPTLADMHDKLEDPAILRGVRDTGGRVVLAIYDCMKPVIGAINGAAVGIGATMTLPMDIRLAADGAKIGFVFGRLGIVPEACSSWFLPRLVGIPQALEWVYSAEPFDAAEGVRAGLLKAVVHRRITLMWPFTGPVSQNISRRQIGLHGYGYHRLITQNGCRNSIITNAVFYCFRADKSRVRSYRDGAGRYIDRGISVYRGCYDGYAARIKLTIGIRIIVQYIYDGRCGCICRSIIIDSKRSHILKLFLNIKIVIHIAAGIDKFDI